MNNRAPRFTIERWMQGPVIHDLCWLGKRHWLLLALFGLAGLGAGAAFLHLYPDTFVSRAQVRFIPPQVNERYVMPNVAMQAEQRIFALTQILNSQLTASRMIETFGLYPEKRIFYPIADLAERFQQDLELRQVAGGSADPNNRPVPSLSIAFRYSNPEVARKVVRRIMELVYEENRRYRGDQSIGTTEFLQQQVKVVVEQISDIETKLSLLPRHPGEGNFSHMVEAEEMHDSERRLTDTKHQLRNVTTERELRSRTVAALEAQLSSLDRQPVSTYPLPNHDLTQARFRAADARQRYAPGHPDREAAEAALKRAEDDGAQQSERERTHQTRQAREAVTAQLARARAEFEGYDSSRLILERDVDELTAKVARLRSLFKPSEVKDLDRLVLTREYAGLQEYYKDLLKKQRESQVASEMERRGQGETVELIEPPTLPGSAESPNWLVKLSGGVMVGLAAGFTLLCLWHLRRPRVLSADHLPAMLDIPVIAELPAGSMLSLGGTPHGPTVALRPRQRLLRGWLTAAGLMLFLVGCQRETPGSVMARATKAAQAGDDATAMVLFRKVIQLDARNAEANVQLAEAYLRAGQVLAARERLIRAVELLPQRLDVAVRLAELDYQVYFADPGRPAPLLREVEELADKMIEKSPAFPDGYRLKSQALLERRRIREAVELLEPVAARLPKDGPLVTQLATCYYQEGRRDDAERTLTGLIERRPDYVQGYDILYLLRMETKRPAEARQVLAQKAKQIPQVANVLQLAAHDDAMGARAAIRQWLPDAVAPFLKDPQAYMAVGDFWLHRAEFREARSIFEEAQERHGAQRSAFAGRIVETHIAEKQPAEAKRLVEAELRSQPADPLLKAYQSALDLEAPSAGDRTRARAQLESILAKLPNSPFVRFHLGRAYLRDGDFLHAGEQLERCVSLDPNYAPGWVALAEANFGKGQGTQAEYIVRATLDRSPAYVPALLMRARLSLSANKPVEAERALLRVLEADAANRPARIGLAQVKLMQGKFAEVDGLLSGLAHDTQALLLRAEARAAAGEASEAIRLIEKERGATPPEGAVRQTLARLALSAGQAAKARDHYAALMQAEPKNLEARLGYANALGLSGDAARAADEYRKVQVASGQDARPWLNYAALMSSQGRVKEARAAYVEAINRDKNNPYALNNLAYLMAKHREDLQSALNYAQQAKRSKPDSAAIHDTLAYIYLLLGMSRDAAAVLEEASAVIEPGRQSLAQDLARRLKKGDTATVLAEIERGALQSARL